MQKTKANAKTRREECYPLFLTPEQASEYSGIGVNKIRTLLDEGKIDFLPNGNRRLIYRQALLDYYEREKVPANPA